MPINLSRRSAPPAGESTQTPDAATLRQRAGLELLEIPSGEFRCGSDSPLASDEDGERPSRQAYVEAFRIASTSVTNAQFRRFIEATGYRTEAEEFGWSFVFHLFAEGLDDSLIKGTAAGTPWWLGVEGAYWAAPEGPGSHLRDREDHPVVHVSYADALAYCRWSGTRLPTETEWEFAARGGLEGALYPWGDEFTPGGEHRCNIWQGEFPSSNTAEDGYVGTAPVRAYQPNGYGLFNPCGNVWEWTATSWESSTVDLRVIRGGSYLCHDSYCSRYRVSARTCNTADSSTGNTGFRVAADAD